jgi:tRNA-splicing ligase RtcB
MVLLIRPVSSTIELVTADDGAIAMGPVGYDIGCGMMSARSNVPAEYATAAKRLEFNREVMKRVAMGAGGKSHKLGRVSEREFQNLIRGGAEYYVEKYGAAFDRSRAERHRIPGRRLVVDPGRRTWPTGAWYGAAGKLGWR